MSMAIKRASYTGDPGIFGDIFSGIKGAIKGGVGGFMGGRQPPIPTAGPGSVGLFPSFGGAAVSNRGKCPPGMGWNRPNLTDAGGRCVPAIMPAPGVTGLLQRIVPFGATGMQAAPVGETSGYHLNKSGYFLLSGEYVPEGSRYVKNRKRNPANARATSRAIGRITGAKKYAASLSRISIRKKC